MTSKDDNYPVGVYVWERNRTEPIFAGRVLRKTVENVSVRPFDAVSLSEFSQMADKAQVAAEASVEQFDEAVNAETQRLLRKLDALLAAVFELDDAERDRILTRAKELESAEPLEDDEDDE